MVGHYVSKGDLFCLLPTLFHPLMKMNLSSDQMNLSSDHIIIFLLCGGGDHMTTVTTFSLPTGPQVAFKPFAHEYS